MVAITALLEKYKLDLVTEFKTIFRSLEAKMDQVQATVSNHSKKISSLESHADSTGESMLSLEATCAKLTTSIEKLQAKAVDLEARSRRNNLRIVGLPESIEGPCPNNFFATLLTRLLGEHTLPSPPVLNRAH